MMYAVIINLVLGMLFSKRMWKVSLIFWVIVDGSISLFLVASDNNYAKAIRELASERYEQRTGMPFYWNHQTEDYTIVAGMKLPPVPTAFRDND